MEDNRTEIPVTDALAALIDGYLRQRDQLDQALRTIAATAAAALGVPDGWYYAAERRAFVQPSEQYEGGAVQ